jgi:hypothetical protein
MMNANAGSAAVRQFHNTEPRVNCFFCIMLNFLCGLSRRLLYIPTPDESGTIGSLMAALR